jgi:hypothetical protein
MSLQLPVVLVKRDARLDLFLGVALWLVFLEYLAPDLIRNAAETPEQLKNISWISMGKYGFSNGVEIFIFISGFTAAVAYSKQMHERGFIVATRSVLRGAWQAYVAYIFLFAIYLAEISYVATAFENPLYAEEMNILDFLKQPDVVLVQGVLLKFVPSRMEILPLYIVLLACFPPMLWLLQFRSTLALGASVLLYVLTWHFNWNMPSYPSGHWYFNPLAWQLLFVFGAWCALGGAQRLSPVSQSPVTVSIAAAYLLFAFVISLTWYLPGMSQYVPHWLEELIYPIDKADLDVLRFAHFCALATLAVWLIPRDWKALSSPILRPAVLCGQHPVVILCLVVFLAFAGHALMVEVSGSIWLQLLIAVSGILIMIATAAVIPSDEIRGAQQREVTGRMASDGPLTGRLTPRPLGSKIFISYRRSDTRHVAGRIYDRLRGEISENEIFFDVDTVPIGVNFRQSIFGAVNESAVMLVLIGEKWINPTWNRSPIWFGVKSKEDFVQVEIELALESGLPVVPILVDGVEMPGERVLPDSIIEFASLNAAIVRSGRDFHTDMRYLLDRIRPWREQGLMLKKE